jgi:transposase
MEHRQSQLALPTVEVPMLEPEIVRQIKGLSELGWGTKRIARLLEVSRNSVRRYLRSDDSALTQVRPLARRVDESTRRLAVELLRGPAEGNAVVVRELLAKQGVEVELRTLQRALAPDRQARRAAELATVRFETAPGHQMQIDFGEKRIEIAGQWVRVMLFVGVLSYSRRLYVRPFLSQRHDDWREGLSGAFRHFGGMTQTVLVDNAGALVLRAEQN